MAKIYKSQAPDIDLPELDILTFLFGKLVNTLIALYEPIKRSQDELDTSVPSSYGLFTFSVTATIVEKTLTPISPH